MSRQWRPHSLLHGLDLMEALLGRIKARHEEEMKAQRPARRQEDIPSAYELITPEWLTNVLCRNVPGAAVVEHKLGSTDDGTSSRRRIHVRYNHAGDAAGLPKSVFCKASQSLQSRLTLGVLGCTHAEHAFYTKVRPQLTMAAPQPIWANYDPDSFASILVLRDLGEDIEFCGNKTNVNRDRAISMVTLLAGVHARFHQHPDLGGEALPFSPWIEWFDRLQAVGMKEYCEKGFRAAEHVIPTRLFKRGGEIWEWTLASVQRHTALPHTLLHSDVHLRNWYVAAGDRMGLADWQSVCIGNWGRDYAYATSCALTVENRRAWEKDLLQIYLDTVRANGGPAISFEEAWKIYRQQLFSALAFWTITLTPPPVMPEDMQPKDITLAFIERFAAAIDDLDALESFR